MNDNYKSSLYGRLSFYYSKCQHTVLKICRREGWVHYKTEHSRYDLEMV